MSCHAGIKRTGARLMRSMVRADAIGD